MNRGRKVSKKTMLDVLDAFKAYFKEHGTQNITYLEFSNYIENNGGDFINYVNELGDILGKLGDITSYLNLPILSTIIVRSGENIPASGYFKMANLHGLYEDDGQLNVTQSKLLGNNVRAGRLEFVNEQIAQLQRLTPSNFDEIKREIENRF